MLPAKVVSRPKIVAVTPSSIYRYLSMLSFSHLEISLLDELLPGNMEWQGGLSRCIYSGFKTYLSDRFDELFGNADPNDFNASHLYNRVISAITSTKDEELYHADIDDMYISLVSLYELILGGVLGDPALVGSMADVRYIRGNILCVVYM